MFVHALRILLLCGCYFQLKSAVAAETISCILDETLASFRIEIRTDTLPIDTQWTINDAFTRALIFSGGPYATFNSLIKHEVCVKRSGCYQFTISDVRGDGLFMENAYYEIFYDDVSIKRGGGDFGFLDHSPLFGDGCPTFAPSLSMAPSKSFLPSQSPSNATDISALNATNSAADSTTDASSSNAADNSAFCIACQDAAPCFDKRMGCPFFDSASKTWSGTYAACNPAIACADAGCLTICEESGGEDGPSVSWKPSTKSYTSSEPTTSASDITEISALCVACQEAALCFDESLGCPFFDVATNTWSGAYEACNPAMACADAGCFTRCEESGEENGPSVSRKPLTEPHTSSEPAISTAVQPPQKPSSSFAPSETSTPTTLPTSLAEFSKDLLGRRRFPPPVIKSSDGSFPFQSLIKCKNSTNSDDDHIGCIVFPKPDTHPKPDWTGKLLQTHPECNLTKSAKNRKCYLDILNSKQLVPTHLKRVSSGFLDMNRLVLTSAFTSPVDVAAIDIDKDGLIDIIVGNFDFPNQIFYNKGNNEFDDPIVIPGGSYFTVGLRFADLDGNGFVDFAVLNYKDTPSFILWNEGRRKFTATEIPTTSGVAFWDFDGDGYLDIVSSRFYMPYDLLLNNGDRTFSTTPLPPYDHPYLSYGAECGDLNNDGNVDIVLNYLEGGTNKLLLNNGDGTFEVSTLPGLSGDTARIRLADIDSNGYLDVIIATGVSLDQQPNQILWNLGNGIFDPQDLPGGKRLTQNIQIVDFDGDGQLDILVVNMFSPQVILFYNGDKSFDIIELPFIGPTVPSCGVRDIDGNGMIDIVCASLDSAQRGGGAFLLMNHIGIPPNNLSGEDFFAANFPGIPQDTVAIVAAPLVSTDNFLNLVIGNFRQPNQLLRISDEGSSSETIILPGGSMETSCIVLTYFNEDSAIDIFVGNINGPNQILVNTGNGNFELIEIPDTQTIPTHAAASADMNNDGHMDLVIGNVRNLNQMLLNDGNGSYTIVDLPGDNLDETMSVALADMDGDRLIDIVIGNGYDEDQPNYLLINRGNNTFMSEELPGGNTRTFSIVVGSLHDNQRVDIIVGSFNGMNYILHDNSGAGYKVKDLPGGSLLTTAMALGDMNGDGNLDIVISNGHIGNTKPNQIILNLGDGTFRESIIPDSDGNSRALAICDLDKDGRLDVVFGNYKSTNVFLYQSVCESGAQLHSQSWCFKCPPFMGRLTLDFFSGKTSDICAECMPGHMQSDSSDACSKFSCLFGERKHGADECTRCPNGTFYDSLVIRREDDPESWEPSFCIDCNAGEYSDWLLPTIDECIKCSTGSSQNNIRSSSCKTCLPGTFQSLRGQPSCNDCKTGGYCSDVDTCGGGFTSCPSGTYNSKEAQSKADACIACPVGTFSMKIEASSIESCSKCLPGSYSSRVGQTTCIRCKKGTFQEFEGQTQCFPCENGTYTDAEGLPKCSTCPFRLASLNNSTSCQFCAKGFYLKDSSIDPSEIFSKPSEHCLDCPDNVICPFNTTLQTLEIPIHHWRRSSHTSTIYSCNNKACKGSSSWKYMASSSYCISGHEGPLCQVCSNDYEFFSSKGICEGCPSLFRLLIPAGIIIALLGVFFISRIAANEFEEYDNFLQKSSIRLSMMSIQPKFKILVTFYQIINSLGDVYGVKVDEKVKGWLSFVRYFNFGLTEATAIPSACIGSMSSRLLLATIWPFVVIILCFLSIACHSHFSLKRKGTADIDMKQVVWMRILQISIIIVFFTLTPVAVTIFEAKKCRPFDSNDATKEIASYLISDWSVRCDQGGSYQQLQTLFWFLFIVWLVAVPLSFFGLLMKIKHSVAIQQVTPLAEACSFLWRDYKKEYMYWEIVSIIYKMLLTGLIMFVDTQEGSEKALRLMTAILVCTVYSSMLLYSCPYKKREDQDLAFVSNALLISNFVLGVPLQQCDDDVEVCQAFYGLHLNSYQVSVLAVVLIVSMLVVTLIIVVVVGFNNDIDGTIIKLQSTNEKPILDLPLNCEFHVFVSHVWSTGQDKSHMIVGKLRKYLPGIKIWIDVECLTNIGSLESSVGASAVIIIMYTDLYFESKNCRREVYAAVRSGKPTLVLYDGKDITVEKMKKSCLTHCIDDDGLPASDVVEHIFSEGAMLWLGASSRYFATASIKELSLGILKNLPYYQRKNQDLSRGLKVKEELGKVNIYKKCNIIISKENSNADQIASELYEMVAKNRNIIFIEDIETYFSKDKFHFGHEAFFLLYLNDKVFTDTNGTLVKQVKNAIESKLNLILVHETDIQNGGVPFERIYAQTPRELLIDPYNIYGEIAVPLYTFEEYRKVSLQMILCKIRDSTNKLTRKKWFGA